MEVTEGFTIDFGNKRVRLKEGGFQSGIVHTFLNRKFSKSFQSSPGKMGLQDSCILIRRKVIEFSCLVRRDQESLYVVLREPRHKLSGPFLHGGTKCTLGWNFADIFFSNSVKIMRFYDSAGTSVS